MEIRCSECGHVGAAAEVRPTGSGVALICAQCGHANELDVGASLAAGATTGSAPAKADAPGPAASESSAAGAAGLPGHQLSIEQVVARANAEREPQENWLSEEAMAQLIPEPGVGPRCRKCAALMTPDQTHCSKCGLGVADSVRFAPGHAPWELPPMGSERAHDQMMLLWEAAQEEWGAERAANFAVFARDEGLHDHAIRLLRFWLVEHPDDPIAEEHLRDLAIRVQSRAVIARAQAEVSAKNFEDGVGKVRWALRLGTVLFWGAVIMGAIGLYSGWGQ